MFASFLLVVDFLDLPYVPEYYLEFMGLFSVFERDLSYYKLLNFLESLFPAYVCSLDWWISPSFSAVYLWLLADLRGVYIGFSCVSYVAIASCS